MNAIMMLIMIFILGVGIGALLIITTLVRPVQKTNEDLMKFIDEWEVNNWNKVK